MFNQTYEEYMRNVLGYMPSSQDMEYTYPNDQNRMCYNTIPTNPHMSNYMSTFNTESMYPDIYKIVYPMVKKTCQSYQGEITEEIIERITMEIFTNVESEMDVTDNPISDTMQNRNTDTKIESKSTKGTKVEENRNQTEKRRRNFLLKDLIQILVLRELLGGNRPPRPPFPGQHPPFLGGSGLIQPRIYEEDEIFY